MKLAHRDRPQTTTDPNLHNGAFNNRLLINKRLPRNLSIAPVHYRSHTALLALLTATGILLSGCGDDEYRVSTDAPIKISDATLLDEPVVTQTFTAEQLKAAVAAADLSDMVAQEPVCGITVEYINHTTTGLKGEATNATAAVILPNGEDSRCQGQRPITLYAHGTTPAKDYNLAALNDPENPAYFTALYVAASYVGQGDILIAPNYPGYDKSELDYAPYVTYQQGRQMLDGLQAGKLAIEKTTQSQPAGKSVSFSDKLFVTGYSQGGYVAMATAKALDDLGQPATAVSPGSGPYAVTAFADSIMSGNIIFGGTLFLPMLTKSYEAEYGGLTEGVYADKYKNSAANLFPTNETLLSIILSGKLPTTQLFQSRPTGYPSLDIISPADPDYAFGFSPTNYLFNTDFRAKYITDMNSYPDGIFPTFQGTNANKPARSNLKVRQAFIDNDLRDYRPKSPMLLCGGNQDPSVTFAVNSYAQAMIWKNNNHAPFALLDVDITNLAEREKAGKTPYISTLPTSLDNIMRPAAAKIQADFANELETMLHTVEENTYNNAINSGIAEPEARAKALQARKDRILQSYDYHRMVDPYCLSAANTFFEQYR